MEIIVVVSTTMCNDLLLEKSAFLLQTLMNAVQTAQYASRYAQTPLEATLAVVKLATVWQLMECALVSNKPQSISCFA